MSLRFIFIIVATLSAQIGSAQIFGSRQIISSTIMAVTSAHSADLDGDGDLDVVSGGLGGIAWHENLGEGQFGTPQLLNTLVFAASCVLAEDLDNDGDMDVLSASVWSGNIVWYENLGGGLFGTQQLITNNLPGANYVYTSDLDADGDMDVLWASQTSSSIGWFENQGGGQFSSSNILTQDASGANCVHAADLDEDGDMDILSSSYLDDKIAWYENLGGWVFGSQQLITTQADNAQSVYAADLDNDDDLDILSASAGDNKIAWYENLSGGLFGNQQIISVQAISAQSVYSADLDLDGDFDVLSASQEDDKIAWYENLDGGNFGIQQIIHSPALSAEYVSAADLDGDGDLDVLEASSGEHNISWFENLTGDGCIDILACNYNPDAWVDNGSCCFGICGCTNPLAANYLETAACETGTCEFIITGTVFFDENENGIMDGYEYGLPYQTVVMQETGQTYITNDDGNFIADISQQQWTSFEVINSVSFPYNTAANPQHFHPNFSSTTQLYFGVSNQMPLLAIDTDLYSDDLSFPCDDYKNFNIWFRNLGNEPIDGIIEFEYDPLFQGYQEVTPIDSVIGNTIYMSYENLLPGQNFVYSIELLTPSVEHIGEYITNVAEVYGYYDGYQVGYGYQWITEQVTCAYDPNDKQASPLGYTDQHLLLQETPQEFVIRFQNTGNAPAQNIRIQDTLDVNFDIESFRLIANTHSVMTTIDPETRLIDFYFENIQLPDSVSNEPASHGLISYMVTPLPDLPVGTVLENTAYIYFDNNDPIVTNTTWTTIHECGGEAAFEGTTAIVCDQPQVNFESSYAWIDNYSWTVDGVEVGTNADLLLSSIDNPEYEVTLTASNPLCTETSTSYYELPDITSIDPCRADFNCDGNRDTQDLLVFMSEFGCLNTCEADLDDNAIVNVVDLFIFISVFDRSCWD